MRIFRKKPLTRFEFTYLGVDSRRVEVIGTHANIKSMAEEDCRNALRGLYKEDFILLYSSPEGS